MSSREGLEVTSVTELGTTRDVLLHGLLFSHTCMGSYDNLNMPEVENTLKLIGKMLKDKRLTMLIKKNRYLFFPMAVPRGKLPTSQSNPQVGSFSHPNSHKKKQNRAMGGALDSPVIPCSGVLLPTRC